MTDQAEPAGEPGVWRRLRSRLLLDRWPWLRVFEDDVRLTSGREIDGFLRIESPDHTQIFALTESRHVLLIREYKYGPDRVALKLPAGYLTDGEEPEAGARRELLEETGYAATEWRRLGSLTVDGNRGMGAAHCYLALGARPVQAADPGVDEDVRVVPVPLAALPELLLAGAIAEVCPVAGIALALLRLDELG